MRKDIKEDWIEALRSGEYEQAVGLLDSKEGQCCLGVLCDILDLVWELIDGISIRTYTYKGEGSYEALPYPLRVELGISAEEMKDLISLNDEGATFNEIADYIEVYL